MDLDSQKSSCTYYIFRVMTCGKERKGKRMDVNLEEELVGGFSALFLQAGEGMLELLWICRSGYPEKVFQPEFRSKPSIVGGVEGVLLFRLHVCCCRRTLVWLGMDRDRRKSRNLGRGRARSRRDSSGQASGGYCGCIRRGMDWRWWWEERCSRQSSTLNRRRSFR